MKNLEIEER